MSPHIVVISGSPHAGSFTRRVAGHFCDLALDCDAGVELIDLHELGLPAMDSDTYEDLVLRPQAVNDFADRVARAGAVVLATPVHHSSFSGLLKGALDHLSADAFAGRPVGLIANAGGLRGGGTACEHLRAVVKALGGWAVPTQVVTHGSDVDGEALSPAAAGRLAEMLDDICWFVGRADRALAGVAR